MTRLLCLLAGLVLLGSVASAPSYAATNSCNLTPAPNAANARIRATCVAAKHEAARLGNTWSVHVPANACTAVDANTFVYDCTAHMTVNSASCTATFRLRGRYRDPARYHPRLVGEGCVK